MKDPYVYEGTNVLINKLNIKDNDKLRQAEADIGVIKLLTVDELKGNKLNFDYLKKIHKHIFEDIYPFAGQVRTVAIRKDEMILGGGSVAYSMPGDIEKDWTKTINIMDQIKWREMPLDKKAEAFSIGIAGLWQAHPFREGNTRTTMTFASHYAEEHDFPLDLVLLKDNAAYVRNALVKASDGQYSEYKYLTNIIKDSIVLGEENHIIKEIKKIGLKPTKLLIEDMKNLNKAFQKLHTVKDLKIYLQSNTLDQEKKELVEKTVDDFAKEEKREKAAEKMMDFTQEI